VRGNQLTDAIRTVAAGDALLAPSITRRLIEEFVSRGPTVSARLPEVLTSRELEVLRLLAAGLSNAEIADRLVVELSTVKTHVNRMLSKLDLRDRTQAVVYAYETGLVVPTAPLMTSVRACVVSVSPVISLDIEEGTRMSNILIRDLPDSVLAQIDAQAARLGISRVEYVRRQLIREAQRTASSVTAADLERSGRLLADLLDEDVMRQAWR
jgi:DNA-binding CsgD family transcriptional regulator